jgi:PleD family two-component response regulator
MSLAASSVLVGRVLLVSDDAIAIEQLSESMQRFALSVEHCTEVSSALERLKRSKFEAVIVDFLLGSQAGAILRRINNEREAVSSPSWLGRAARSKMSSCHRTDPGFYWRRNVSDSPS